MFIRIYRKFRFLLSIAKNYYNSQLESHFLSGTIFPSIILSSILTTGLLLGIRQLGSLQSLELAAYDLMVRKQEKTGVDPRLLVVEITEADIQNQKRWPISDLAIARTIENLQQYNPKVIGLDLYRDIPNPPGHAALLKQLKADNVIVIQELGVEKIPPPPSVPLERIGFNDFLLDPDNVIRRNLLYARLGEEEFLSFSLRLSLRYLAEEENFFEFKPNAWQIGKTVFLPLEANSGGYQMEESEAVGWQVMLDYDSRRIARRITLTEVLNGEIAPRWVKDKIVLIGTTAPSQKDLFATPYSGRRLEAPGYLMPGVIVHAQMTSQILDAVLNRERQIWYLPQWGEILWIWSWSFLGAILTWRSRHPLELSVTLALGIGGLFLVCLILFATEGWIPLIPSVLALAIASASVLSYRILYITFHDPLTGLANRRSFTQKLKNRQEQNETIAIFCLDLDRFKLINEGLGNEAGDRLLMAMSKRLKTLLCPSDLLARVGPDEFALAKRGIEDKKAAIAIADNLQKELTLPFNLQGEETFTTVSIGIAFHKIGQNFQPENLLRDAHTAMYKAKGSGKAHYELFVSKIHERALARLQLEAALRQGIKNEEFLLYYQPIISLSSGRIAGFESLVRWQSAKRGLVSPGAFIPVAEETGLIIPLGKQILQQACRQMRLWQEEFSDYPFLTISVNLSGRQFSQPDLVEQIEEILLETKLNPIALKLEITESMVMDDVERAIIILERLKSLNLQLSMDDFGTGFSSFSYLHRFPMDILKVDRSFVSRIDESLKNREIVSTIVMLAHKLGMNVVAEGIETFSQTQTLKMMQCEYGQGYFFSKPLSFEDTIALLAKNPQW